MSWKDLKLTRKQNKMILECIRIQDFVINNWSNGEETLAITDELKNSSSDELVKMIQEFDRADMRSIRAYYLLFQRVYDIFHDVFTDENIIGNSSIRRVDPKLINKQIKLKYLSKGGNGMIYKIKFKKVGKIFLILKIAKNKKQSIETLHEATVNIYLLSQLKGESNYSFPHIPKIYLPSFITHVTQQHEFKNNNSSEKICYISELIQKPKSMTEFLQSKKCSLDHIVYIIFQLCIVLDNSQRHCLIMHYDLHTENVLIEDLKKPRYENYTFSNNVEVKLKYHFNVMMIDFGQSCVFDVATKEWIQPYNFDKDEGLSYNNFLDNQFTKQPFYPMYDIYNFINCVIDVCVEIGKQKIGSTLAHIMKLWFKKLNIKLPQELDEFYDMELEGESYLSSSGSSFHFPNTKKFRELSSQGNLGDLALHIYQNVEPKGFEKT